LVGQKSLILPFLSKNTANCNLTLQFDMLFCITGLQNVDLAIKQGQDIAAYEIKWGKNIRVSKIFGEQYRVPVKIIAPSDPLFFRSSPA